MNGDDFDKLKAAMRAATPKSDDAKKAANLALARKNFDRLQGSANVLRQTPDCPESGFVRRAKMTLNFLSYRAALTTTAVTTAIVAVAAVAFLPMGDAFDSPETLPMEMLMDETPDSPETITSREAVAPEPTLQNTEETDATVDLLSEQTAAHPDAQFSTAMDGDAFDSLAMLPMEMPMDETSDSPETIASGGAADPEPVPQNIKESDATADTLPEQTASHTNVQLSTNMDDAFDSLAMLPTTMLMETMLMDETVDRSETIASGWAVAPEPTLQNTEGAGATADILPERTALHPNAQFPTNMGNAFGSPEMFSAKMPMGKIPDSLKIFDNHEAVIFEQGFQDLGMAYANMNSQPAQTAWNLGAQLPTILMEYSGEGAFPLEESWTIESTWLPIQSNTEEFASADDSPVKIVAENPVSTFSIDVDTASYSVVRSSLMNGSLPPAAAVRVEEMINYFPYAHPAPDGDAPFRPTVSVAPTPWNGGTKLVQIAIQGALPEVENRPPLNLVFLIDTSGSMDWPNKLPLLQQSFRLLLEQLRPDDEVAIVTYAGSAGQVLDPTPARERDTIRAALDQLHAGGSTAGQAGLQQAYATARDMTRDGEVTRVILATDGDFNVGLSDPEDLKNFIKRQAEGGAYLSVLGFGRGNLDDATMQALAQHGNGMAAYIDTLGEAQKVLVDQLSGALFPIANDVKIQVEFNPAQVAEYRLIGYETRALRREDFNNDAVDAGEIGAGHSVTAIYEVTPVDSPARLSDPLRYQADEVVNTSDELGFLRLRYKLPGHAVSQLIELPITSDLEPSPEAGFAAAIAGFGQLLRGSDYLSDWSWGDAITLASASRGDDPFGYRAEAVQLMRLAQSLDQQR